MAMRARPLHRTNMDGSRSTRSCPLIFLEILPAPRVIFEIKLVGCWVLDTLLVLGQFLRSFSRSAPLRNRLRGVQGWENSSVGLVPTKPSSWIRTQWERELSGVVNAMKIDPTSEAPSMFCCPWSLHALFRCSVDFSLCGLRFFF